MTCSPKRSKSGRTALLPQRRIRFREILLVILERGMARGVKMELRFGDEDQNNQKHKDASGYMTGKRGDLLRDLYGDLYGAETEKNADQSAVQSPENRKEGVSGEEKLRSGSSLEQEMDALSRAQEALMEAARKFNREGVQKNTGAEEKTEKKAEPETDPMEDLNELIGLAGIKHDVRELYDFTKIQKLRRDAGLKTVPVSMHLVFTGNPGTGKTTVARILARLYKQIGVLSKGQLVECDRSGLVAGYVGQTAVKTQKKIEEAMGGVLFIDEAYSLARGADQGNDFGQEAIDTLLKAMEDHRDEFVVIVAGYTKPMKTFIHSNPGLQSRFNKFIEFPDYSVEELLAIFDLNCRKYQYVPDKEARDQVKTLLMLRKAQTPENFANAREVRNLFESIITNQARRIAALANPTPEEMQRIKVEDLRDESDDAASEEKILEKTAKFESDIDMSLSNSSIGAEASAENGLTI